MELFLNICWISLLLPAYLLWRQQMPWTASRRANGWGVHPLVFVCALGCVLILLFPVVSATDDLHVVRPEMEESESAVRGASRCTSANHAPTHSTQTILPSMACLLPDFEQVGTVMPLRHQQVGVFSSPVPAGRAPPATHLLSL